MSQNRTLIAHCIAVCVSGAAAGAAALFCVYAPTVSTFQPVSSHSEKSSHIMLSPQEVEIVVAAAEYVRRNIPCPLAAQSAPTLIVGNKTSGQVYPAFGNSYVITQEIVKRNRHVYGLPHISTEEPCVIVRSISKDLAATSFEPYPENQFWSVWTAPLMLDGGKSVLLQGELGPNIHGLFFRIRLLSVDGQWTVDDLSMFELN